MTMRFSPSAVDPKDPDIDTEYIMNWTNALPPEVTVAESFWTTKGITQAETGIVSGKKTRIVTRGGVAGQNYYAKNRIVRSDGVQDTATGIIRVRR